MAVAVLNHQTNFPAATSTRAAATTWWRGDGVHTQKRDDNSRSHSHVVVVAVRNYLNNTVSDVIQDENILPVVAKNSVRIDVVAMKLVYHYYREAMT